MGQQLLHEAILRRGLGFPDEARYHRHQVALLGSESEDLGILDDVEAVAMRARTVQVRTYFMQHGSRAEQLLVLRGKSVQTLQSAKELHRAIAGRLAVVQVNLVTLGNRQDGIVAVAFD